MKNLDQIRASNALKATKEKTFSGKDGGEIAKKVPTIIRENGILGALAFALEKKGKKGEYAVAGMKDVLDAIVEHLSDPRIQRLPASVKDAEMWLEYLVNDSSSDALREQTAEAMAYLSYFRRFAHKE